MLTTCAPPRPPTRVPRRDLRAGPGERGGRMARHTGNAVLKGRARDTALKRPRRTGDIFSRSAGRGNAPETSLWKGRAGDTAVKRRAGLLPESAGRVGTRRRRRRAAFPGEIRVFLRLLGGGAVERRASGFPIVEKSGFSPIFFFPGRKKILTSRRIYTIIFFEQGRSSGGSFTLLAALFSLSDSLSGQS